MITNNSPFLHKPLVGCLAISIIGKIGLVPSVYSAKWMFFSFIVSLSIGVLFGLFPACKAANLSPIEALRSN